jgi:hypothetical protein
VAVLLFFPLLYINFASSGRAKETVGFLIDIKINLKKE